MTDQQKDTGLAILLKHASSTLRHLTDEDGKRMADFLRSRLERKIRALKDATDLNEVMRAQGAVKELEFILDLKDICTQYLADVRDGKIKRS